MPKRNVLWMLAVVAVAVGTAWLMKRTPQAYRERRTSPDAMVDAYNKILKNYYRPVDSQELRRDAVAGMFNSLDSRSVYVPYDRAEAFNKRLEGQARGTGLIMDLSDRGPVIACIHPNSPADEAGLVAGQLLVAIEDQPSFSMSIGQVNEHLAGGQDGQVKLRVISPRAGAEPRDVVLLLAEYPVETVTGLYRNDEGRWVCAVDREHGLAYIRITEFVEGTVDRFRRAFRRLSVVRGLVLDLRGNPGGHLSEGVAMANLFLDDKPIVTVLGNAGRVEKHLASEEGTYPKIPVVVLIDSDTASAAEIVAGAMSCADRAILLGVPSRGKHSVQTPLPLGGKLGLLHLTTAKFYFGDPAPEATSRPAAGILPASAGKPIVPHVVTLADPNKRRELQLLRWRGASRRLAPTSVPATQPATSPDASLGRMLIRTDRQLAAAIELLRDPARIDETLRKCAQARELKKRAGATSKKHPTNQRSKKAQ